MNIRQFMFDIMHNTYALTNSQTKKAMQHYKLQITDELGLSSNLGPSCRVNPW